MHFCGIIMTNIVIHVIIFLHILHHDLVTTSDIVCDDSKCSSDDRPCQGLHQLNPPKIVPGMEWRVHLSSIIISAIIWNGEVQTFIFGLARTKLNDQQYSGWIFMPLCLTGIFTGLSKDPEPLDSSVVRRTDLSLI